MRAVSRAAFYIVRECHVQFRDLEIWNGTKKPDYGRVVDICTSTAQKELIGPGFLAIGTPFFVGTLVLNWVPSQLMNPGARQGRSSFRCPLSSVSGP